MKGVANRRREWERFKRILVALSYGGAERFRHGPEKEAQISKEMNGEGKTKTQKRKEGIRI